MKIYYRRTHANTFVNYTIISKKLSVYYSLQALYNTEPKMTNACVLVLLIGVYLTLAASK